MVEDALGPIVFFDNLIVIILDTCLSVKHSNGKAAERLFAESGNDSDTGHETGACGEIIMVISARNGDSSG